MIVRPVLLFALSGLSLTASPILAQDEMPPVDPGLVAADVVWPEAGGVVRSGANGLSLDGGVASVDESASYSLTTVSTDETQDSVRFTYADSWTLKEPVPATCAFTFRRLGQELTQPQANLMARRLANTERDALKQAHPDLAATAAQGVEGSAVVHQYVDRFTFTEEGKTVHGLGRSWIFVLRAKPYYVHKVCLSHDTAEDVIVIDQLIGLDYHRDAVAN